MPDRIINIQGINIILLENRDENATQIQHELGKLKEEVKTKFTYAGIEPDDDSDRRVLVLILKIICHAQCFPQNHINRGRLLLAISTCVEMLSERSRYTGDLERFIERYETNEMSIWRDLIFIRKMAFGDSDEPSPDERPIHAIRLARIFTVDLNQLGIIVADAVNGSPVRKPYRNPAILPNILEWVTYYREQECLEKIIAACSEENLAAIDITTNAGKTAILRILQIIGENLTKKNLSDSTRLPTPTLYFDLLVDVRNRLAHNEWDLFEDKFPAIFALDYRALFDSIRFIRIQIETIYANHQHCKKTPDGSDLHSDKAITRFYTPELDWKPLPETTKNIILLFLKDLIARGRLTEEVCASFINFLEEDIEVVYPNIVDRFKVLVRPFYSGDPSSPGPEDAVIRPFIGQMYNQIKKDKTAYEKREDKYRAELEKARNNSLPAIRSIQALLPDDHRYKSSGAEEGHHDPALVIKRMLDTITHIENLLCLLKEYPNFLRDMVTPFKAEACFVHVPGCELGFGHAKVDAAHALVRTHLTHTDSGMMVPLPKMLMSSEPLSMQGTRAVTSKEGLDKLINYAIKSQQRVARELMNFALEIRMANELSSKTALRMALEFFAARLIPFLRFAIIQKFPGLGIRLKNLELRFYRNFLEHGNMFVEQSIISPEHFLIRYISTLLNDIKHILMMNQALLASPLFLKTICNNVNISPTDLSKTHSRKQIATKHRWKTREKISSDYTIEITDHGAGGDCLFRSLAVQIGVNAELGTIGDVETDHILLRQLVVASILSQRETLGDLLNDERLTLFIDGTPRVARVDSFDGYIRAMGMQGTWGGQIEILALARLLGRPTVLLGENIRPQFFEENAHGEPLILYYTGDHYQAVRHLAGTAQELFLRILRDDTAVQAAIAGAERSRASLFRTGGAGGGTAAGVSAAASAAPSPMRPAR